MSIPLKAVTVFKNENNTAILTNSEDVCRTIDITCSGPTDKSGISVAHPDLLSIGGALETKKLGDMCEQYGVGMAIHMAESPIACMAAIHTAAALQNVMAVEFHSVDIPWWNDLAIGIDNPLFKNGFVDVPNKPGLGIDELNEELIAEHIHDKYPGIWEPTDEWNNEWANDREWS